MAESARVSSKGQVVIPAKLRKEIGLKAGTLVVFRKQGSGLLIEPGSYQAVMALRGKYAGLPLEEDLAQERRKWDERLEAM